MINGCLPNDKHTIFFHLFGGFFEKSESNKQRDRTDENKTNAAKDDDVLFFDGIFPIRDEGSSIQAGSIL